MTTRGQQLHDRATRGELLTHDEQHELEQWYTNEDRIEGRVLQVAAVTEADTQLQRQVNATLDQLQRVTRQIQELSVENAAVRREIAELRYLLTQRRSAQAA